MRSLGLGRRLVFSLLSFCALDLEMGRVFGGGGWDGELC